MKIKFIMPQMTLRPRDAKGKTILFPPLHLMTIASLTPKGHDLSLEDRNVKKFGIDTDVDVVCITVIINTVKSAYKIAEQYKQQGSIVVFGGIYTSSHPEEVLKHGDIACIGEAEEIWSKIIKDIEQKTFKRIYRYNGLTDLSKIPVPKRDLIHKSDYLYNNIVYISRGCPFNCDFCYQSCSYFPNGYRTRPTKDIVRDIEATGTKHIMFIDDNLIGNIEFTKEFFTSIIPLGLTRHGAVSANILHQPEIMDIFEKSGCKFLFVGFESINKSSLQNSQKHQNQVELYEKLIDELHKRNIMVNASIVFGFDNDTKTVFDDTLERIFKNKIDIVSVNVLTPCPGTKLYQKMSDQGRIIDHDTNHYDMAHVIYKPKNMTAEELSNGYLNVYDKTYSWKGIIKRFPKHKKLIIPYLLANLGYKKFMNIISLFAKIGLYHRIGKIGRRLAYGVKK